MVVQQQEDSQEEQLDFDEIKAYLNARYMTAYEACWRIFEFELCGNTHVVEFLPVHLPDYQSIIFEEGMHESAVEAGEPTTKLLSYF